MRRTLLITLSTVMISLAAFVSCGQAPTAKETELLPAVEPAAINEQALAEMMDRRIAIALADWDVSRQVHAQETTLAGLLAETRRVTTARGQGASAGSDPAATAVLNELADKVNRLSADVEQAMASNDDLAQFENRMLAAVTDLQAAQQTYPEYATYTFEPETPGGERVPILDRVTDNVSKIAGIVGQLQELRGALDSFRSSGDPTVVEDYVYYDFPEDYTWDYGDTSGSGTIYEFPATAAETTSNTATVDARVIAASSGGALATRDFASHPGVTLEVLSLKKSAGNTVTLDFAMTNTTEEGVRLDTHTLFSSGAGYSWNVGKSVSLVDPSTMTSYTVAKTSDGSWLCSQGYYDDMTLQPGERRTFWIRFPTPPTSTVSVVFPDGKPIDGMRIAG